MSDISFSGDLLDLGITPLTPEQLGQIDPALLEAAGTPGSVQEVQPVTTTPVTTTTTEKLETEAERIARLDREQRAAEFATMQAGAAAAAEARRENAFGTISAFLQRAGLQGLEGNIRGLLAQGIVDTDAILFNLRAPNSSVPDSKQIQPVQAEGYKN